MYLVQLRKLNFIDFGLANLKIDIYYNILEDNLGMRLPFQCKFLWNVNTENTSQENLVSELLYMELKYTLVSKDLAFIWRKSKIVYLFWLHVVTRI
jgi:hypothetical protein